MNKDKLGYDFKKEHQIRLKCIWSEDDATLNDPDRRTLRMEWKERFNEELDTSKATMIDDSPGDATFYYMPNGYI